MTLQIEWVNHAAFVLHTGEVHLMTDPWLWGSAFHNGWDLLSETRFQINDFERVSHIWFSHEHPDHFAPAVLKQIPLVTRRQITVIFQETKDGKVVNYCRDLEFQVQELKNQEWRPLSPTCRVLCGKTPFFDSWLLIEAENQKILNANDCVVDGEGITAEIARYTGVVDVLLTQFSYANWDGNPEETERRRDSAREKLRRVKLQIETFRPRYTIPFASFVYFSHEDNFFCNDAINTVRVAHDFILRETASTPVILYPGDRWTISDAHNNQAALAAYDHDYVLEKKPLRKSEPVALDELTKLAQAYIQRIKTRNSRLLMRWMRLPPLHYFQPIKFWLTDLGCMVEFTPNVGLAQTADSRAAAHVELAAESLAFILRFDWGFDTLTVNGRFRATQANYKRFVKTFFVGTLNNTGRYLHPRTLFEPSFIKRAFTKLRKLG